MTILLIILYVIVCVFLILVVLLQQGKGADLAGAFGGGGTQTSFGPRSSTNIMHRMTTVSFVLFVILSLGLAIMSGKNRATVITDEPVEPAVDYTLPAEESVAGVEEEGEGGPTSAQFTQETPAEDAGQEATGEEQAADAEAGAGEQPPSSE